MQSIQEENNKIFTEKSDSSNQYEETTNTDKILATAAIQSTDIGVSTIIDAISIPATNRTFLYHSTVEQENPHIEEPSNYYLEYEQHPE